MILKLFNGLGIVLNKCQSIIYENVLIQNILIKNGFIYFFFFFGGGGGGVKTNFLMEMLSVLHVVCIFRSLLVCEYVLK